MELQLKKNNISCLETPLREIQNIEEAQELKLSEGMPDIGRILASWGQVILRSKEWRTDSISLSGGVMVWVLYVPEDGTEPRCMDGWIPFQMKWDLPRDTREGEIRIQCLQRFVDARSVSPRRIMVRTGVAALAEAFSPVDKDVFIPGDVPEDVALRRMRYPVRLPREAGEKSFSLDEDLVFPGSAPHPEKLVCYRIQPQITDKKVLANKVVFRGTAGLHVLYRSEEGQLHCWDFELPFSQYGELNSSYSNEAEADVRMGTTSLDLDLDDEGHLHCKCGLVGQYLVSDQEILELVEDAYSTSRELTARQEMLELPALLENRRDSLSVEQNIPMEVDVVTDLQFLPDFPRQRRWEDRVDLEFPGNMQALYYGEGGELQSSSARWEGHMQLPTDEDSRLSAVPLAFGEPQAVLGSGSALVRSELPVAMETTTARGIPMVTGLELGQDKQADPNRPSLILRRAGTASLWDIAKESGSTMEAIRSANALDADPAPGRMLLIPVP